ncbi:MAG: DUF2179 domain-containing protein [Bacteroidetes bacterium]|nr:DUF2179 domain-containing protein [Bacteroidota bacterium]
MDTNFFGTDLYVYFLLPLLIFLARICDVTIGTMRIIMISKGRKLLAPVLGFFEILIWIMAIGKIMQNLSNPVCYIAYAGGFAIGNYVGMKVEEKLAMGLIVLRIITQKDASELIKALREMGFGITEIDAMGKDKKVHVIFSIIKRHDAPVVVEKINNFNPKAFYTIEDIRAISQGVFPAHSVGTSHGISRVWRLRKGK